MPHTRSGGAATVRLRRAGGIYSASTRSSERTSYSARFSRPSRNASSMRKAQATTSPSSCSTSWHSPRPAPPVASRSSWTSTRAPAATASEWTSSASVAYSSTYSPRTVSCGSLPGLARTTNPAPSSRATAGPSRKPRASAPMTTSTRRSRARSASPVTAASSPSGEARTGVMSLKTMPGFGKSGMSRTSASRSTAMAGLSGDDLAQVADEEQVLEVRGEGGGVLERLDGLLAALGVARAQGRGEDLLQQRGLAVGAGAEGAQVAPADAVAGQLGDGAHDLALGLVVVLRPGADLALDDAVLLELGDQPWLRARLLDDVLQRVQRPAGGRGDRRVALAPHRARAGDRPVARGRDVVARAARGELLADDAQRQELVALQAQDGAQALHVAAGVEAVAARRASRRHELLILQIADLRDRDVGELLLERLADGADRHRLARCAGVGVGLDLVVDGFRFVLDGHERHCERKVSLNLPTCSSSPSSRRWDSMR